MISAKIRLCGKCNFNTAHHQTLS